MTQDTNTPNNDAAKKHEQELCKQLESAVSNLVGKIEALDEFTKPIDHFIELLALGNRIHKFQPYKKLKDAVRDDGSADATLDARMFVGRKDTKAYTALYGLEPGDRKDAYYAINALNRHAKLLLDKESDISVDVEEKYQKFLRELKQADDFPHPKNEPESLLAKAYLAYMEAAGHDID